MTARSLAAILCATLIVAASPGLARGQNTRPATAAAAPAPPQALPTPPAPPQTLPTPPAPPQLLPTPPAPPTVRTAPRKAGQLVNVKTEFTFTEQRAEAPAVKRTVSLIVADGEAGSIRSQPEVYQLPGGLQLNVDVRPELVAGNKIRLTFSLQYDGPGAPDSNASPLSRGTVMRNQLRESLSVILEDGKPLVVAQSADPTTARTVAVEVKVTVLK